MSLSEEMIKSIHAHDLEAADSYFESALQEDSLEDLYALADALYELGFTNYLKDLAEYLLNVYGENDELKLVLAEIHFENDGEDSAFDYLLQIDSSSEAYPRSLLLQADIYQANQLMEVAESKLLEAVELLGEHPVLEFALAEFYFSQGRFLEAIHYYDKLLERDMEIFSGTNIYFRLAMAHSSIGDFETAISFYHMSLELEDHLDIHFQLAVTYFHNEKSESALKHFDKVKEQDPSYSSVYPYLADIYLNWKDLERAKEAVDEGLKYDQVNAELFSSAASIYSQLGESGQAGDFFDKALKLDSLHVKLRIQYIDFLMEQGDFEGVIHLTEEADSLQVIDPLMTWAEARAYEEIEEYDQAKTAYGEAYPALRESLDFNKDYLNFLRDEGEWDKLQSILDKMLEIYPNDADLLLFKEQLSDY